MAAWKQIGCAVDFSAHSWNALQRAVALAGRLGAQLTLVHVVPPGLGGTPFKAERALGLAEERLLAMLGEWRAVAEHDLGRSVETRLLAGSPAAELARFAGGGLDLLVVGTRGATGLGRLFLGSVAERVTRDATCPVMVVHERENDEARAPPPS
jgi:nucleotide-binding universal stress UspA family protein